MGDQEYREWMEYMQLLYLNTRDQYLMMKCRTGLAELSIRVFHNEQDMCTKHVL